MPTAAGRNCMNVMWDSCHNRSGIVRTGRWRENVWEMVCFGMWDMKVYRVMVVFVTGRGSIPKELRAAFWWNFSSVRPPKTIHETPVDFQVTVSNENGLSVLPLFLWRSIVGIHMEI